MHAHTLFICVRLLSSLLQLFSIHAPCLSAIDHSMHPTLINKKGAHMAVAHFALLQAEHILLTERAAVLPACAAGVPPPCMSRDVSFS